MNSSPWGFPARCQRLNSAPIIPRCQNRAAGLEHIPLNNDGVLVEKVQGVTLQDPELGSNALLCADVTDPCNDAVVLLPKGSRIDLKSPHRCTEEKQEFYAKAVAVEIRERQALWIRKRPFGSELAMPLRPGDLKMFRDKKTLQQASV